MTAVPPPSELLLARGHELTARLRTVEGDLSAWTDELSAAKPETVDAQMHADRAFVALDQARTAIGVFTQIVAGMGT